MQDFIRWPSTLAEITKTSLSFVEIILFQRIIGAIDGCHIQIKTISNDNKLIIIGKKFTK